MSRTARISWFLLLAAVATVPTVVGTLPFGYQFMLNPFSSPAVTLLGVLVGGSALIWAIAYARGEVQLRYHPLALAIVALLVLMALSTLRSLDPLYSLFGDGDDLNGLLAYVGAALAMFLVLAHCTGSKRLAELTSTVIYSGLVVAGIALFQQLFAVDIFREVGAGQWPEIGWLIHQGSSTLGNPNFTGNYLVFPATLALYRALKPAQPRADAVRNGAVALVIVIALVLTLTRGAWIGVGVAIALWAAITLRRAGKLPREFAVAAGIAGVAVLGMLAYAGPEIARRVVELVGPGLHGLTGRTLVWSEALAVIRAHPLSGTGPAAFRLGWYGVRTIPGLVAGVNVVATDAHSVPLMIAATTGIPALLGAAAALLGALALSGKRVWDRASRVSADYIAWWAATAALTVTALGAMSTTPLLLALFLAVGVLLAPTAREAALSATPRYATIALLSIAALASVASGSAQGIAHTSARTALTRSPEALRAIAERPPWSGHLAVLAARFQGEIALAEAPQRGAESTREALDAIYAPHAGRHPNDFEFPQWWSTQLFMAGNTLGATDLLTYGLEVSERAIELYPNAVPVRANRARALLALDRTDEARGELAPFAGRDEITDFPALDELWGDLKQPATTTP